MGLNKEISKGSHPNVTIFPICKDTKKYKEVLLIWINLSEVVIYLQEIQVYRNPLYKKKSNYLDYKTSLFGHQETVKSNVQIY